MSDDELVELLMKHRATPMCKITPRPACDLAGHVRQGADIGLSLDAGEGELSLGPLHVRRRHLALLYLVAAWAIVTGILEIVGAIGSGGR